MDCVRWPPGLRRMGLDSKQFLRVMQLLSSHRLSWNAVYTCTHGQTHTEQNTRWMRFTRQKSQTMQCAMNKCANLDMSIESAGALGAVRDPIGLLVYGGEARWRGRCTLCVTLNAWQQDATQRGLGGRVQHQLGWKAWDRDARKNVALTILKLVHKGFCLLI